MSSENYIAGLSSTEIDPISHIQQYIPLIESRRAWKGNCPFHNDSSTSLMILLEKKIFKCFGCGKEGSIDNLLSLLTA